MAGRGVGDRGGGERCACGGRLLPAIAIHRLSVPSVRSPLSSVLSLGLSVCAARAGRARHPARSRCMIARTSPAAVCASPRRPAALSPRRTTAPRCVVASLLLSSSAKLLRAFAGASLRRFPSCRHRAVARRCLRRSSPCCHLLRSHRRHPRRRRLRSVSQHPPLPPSPPMPPRHCPRHSCVALFGVSPSPRLHPPLRYSFRPRFPVLARPCWTRFSLRPLHLRRSGRALLRHRLRHYHSCAVSLPLSVSRLPRPPLPVPSSYPAPAFAPRLPPSSRLRRLPLPPPPSPRVRFAERLPLRHSAAHP